MNDIHKPTTARRPGIAIVRPKLHENTEENQGLFKRWTKLHMRDMLNLPNDSSLGGVPQVLRYKRSDRDGGEEYFYTVYLEDVRLLSTEPFQNISQRLDLEDTRVLGKGEEAVLPSGDPRVGRKPMVFEIAGPTVGVFERSADCRYMAYYHNIEFITIDANI